MHADVLERVGRYEIVGELGAGSMSRVFLAHDPNLDREVAVKIVLQGFSLDSKEQSELERRFLLEARAAGKLSHPGIVRVYDADTDPHLGIPYIAMEWVQGCSLRNLLEDGNRLQAPRALDFLSQVARALDHAHRAGRIHRDVKPSNILITADNVAKISDFGVAKIVSETHTVSGQILGTPAYMSPEQIKDEPLDGRSDLFSLGAVLYQCVAGETPFGGDSLVQVVYKILNVDPRPLPLDRSPLLGDLEAVIDRALQKDPRQRFQTGAEFAGALDGIRNSSRDVAHATFPLAKPRPVDEPPMDTVPGLELGVPRRRPEVEPPPRSATRTVQLGTTSIRRVVRPIGDRSAAELGPHDTVITESGSAQAPTRRRWLWAVAVALCLMVAMALGIAFEDRMRPEATPRGEPITLALGRPWFEPLSVSGSNLTFPAQPEPAPTPSEPADTSSALKPQSAHGRSPAASLHVAEVRPDSHLEATGTSPGAGQIEQDPPLPPTVLTPVTILYRHKGGPSFLSIALDGQRVWSQELKAVEGKLQRLTGYDTRAVVPVPSGTHTLQIALADPQRRIEAAGSIRSRYTSGARRLLRVSVDASANSLELRWKE